MTSHYITQTNKLTRGQRLQLGFMVTGLPLHAEYKGPSIHEKVHCYTVTENKELKYAKIPFNQLECLEFIAVQQYTTFSVIRPNLWYNLVFWMCRLPNYKKRFNKEGMNVLSLSHLLFCECVLKQGRN